jgi:hypothetical protein
MALAIPPSLFTPRVGGGFLRVGDFTHIYHYED